MALQLLDLRTVEPVAEALAVERVGLGVDGVVVEGRRLGRLHRHDLEGQPAARPRRVRQELHVVARAAERRQVRAPLVVALVGGTLVDRRHGHGGLQLVQLTWGHGVQLLPAHQPVLRQHQQVVLRHQARIGLRVEVGLQLGRQQAREPRRLVRPLRAYEHQHDVVDHIRVHPRGHHAHEPLLQVLPEQYLLVGAAAHADRHGQGHDGIVLTGRPRRQRVQVLAEGVVARHVGRLDDALQVLLQQRLLLVHPFPQRVDVAVGHVHVAVGHPAVLAGKDGQQPLLVSAQLRAGGQPPYLRAVTHLVVAQCHTVVQHALDLVRRGILLLPRLLVAPGGIGVAAVLRFPAPFLLAVRFVVHSPVYSSQLVYHFINALLSYNFSGANTSIRATNFLRRAK